MCFCCYRGNTSIHFVFIKTFSKVIHLLSDYYIYSFFRPRDNDTYPIGVSNSYFKYITQFISFLKLFFNNFIGLGQKKWHLLRKTRTYTLITSSKECELICKSLKTLCIVLQEITQQMYVIRY
jgi:hypothetical protein